MPTIDYQVIIYIMGRFKKKLVNRFQKFSFGMNCQPDNSNLTITLKKNLCTKACH
jgi:hypothetical protein